MKHKIYLLLTFVNLYISALSQNVNQEWFKEFSEKNERGDLRIKIDNEGFIYIAGTFDSGNNGIDWKLIKLNPAGDTIFNITFNGEFNGDDFVNAIALDEDNNIYLTGRFSADGDQSSIATFKINNIGEIIWQVISTPSEGINEGSYILTDSLQNVFVGGNSGSAENSDVFLKKYNIEGDLVWSYVHTSPNNELIKGLQPYYNGNIAIACNVFRSENWDILLLCINQSGSIRFEVYYDGRDQLNDECNDIAIDENNNVYLTGYSVNNESKDYVTIKWNENGELEWFALFDEKQQDDQAVCVKIIENYIIVTGNCLTGESGSQHSDIVTILYDDRGVQLWKQKFNGRDSGNDLVVKILTNVANNEFILAAKVWFSESASDVYLLNYTIDGGLIWSINYNDSLSSDNFLSDVAIDFLGNIYIASNVESNFNIKGEVVKFNQPDKYIPVLKDFLKTLAVGLLDLSHDSIVKNVLYEQCVTVIDSFYNIRYTDLISRCATRGLNLQEQMNNKISEYFGLPEFDYVDYIFKRIWLTGTKCQPMIAVPHYHHFNPTQLEDDPKLAYTFEESNYPLPCLNCTGGTIDNETTESFVTWLTLIGPIPPHYYINGNPFIYITNCLVSKFQSPNTGDNCRACPSTIPVDGIPEGSGPGAQDWELNIVSNSDGCLDIHDPNPYNPSNLSNYVRLSKLYGLTYFKRVTLNYSNHYWAVKKLENPLMDKFHFDDVWSITPPSKMEGDILIICEDNAFFNTWDDEPTGAGSPNWPRYAIGYGLYQITRPGVDYQRPLYFYIPYQAGFWYFNGPDLRLYYGTNFTGSNCSNGYRQIEEDYETRYCAFCGVGASVFGFTQPTDYIATTDYSFIKNYWNDNVLTIGVTPYYTSSPANNLYEIEAHNYAQATCSIPPSTTLISTFSLSANGEYDIQKYLGPGGTQVSFPVGTQLYLQIKANFKNGEYIDLNKCITINDTPRGMLKVQIRGDIKDYNASVINYEIKIYQ